MNMAAIRIVTMCAVAAVAVAWEVPAIPAGRRAQFYLLKDDGGYQYGYDTGAGHSASAAADAANEVLGAFQYKATDGRDVAVRYTAGQGGYVPEVSGVQGVAGDAGRNFVSGSRAGAVSATVTNAAEQDPDYDPNADASYSFSIDTDSYQRTEQADARGNVRGSYSYSSPHGGSHALSYAAGEGTGFVVTGGAPSHAAGAALGAIAGGRVGAGATSHDVSGGAANTDGSYSFSFNTPDQSRQESADAKNNVRGSYSFRAKDDGKTRRVDYEAGTATGFVAKGDHLPVAPAAPSMRAHAHSPSVSPADPATSYSGPLASIQSTQNGDGSYNFAFGTDFISREESADAQNNVRGSYSYTSADDGKTRRVDYEAGAATGFLARGNHLPVPPSVPGAPTSQSAQLPVLASISSVIPYSGPVADVKDSTNVDGSYSFSFNTPDQSRQESSDAQNNVRGSYSFKAKEDGKVRRVDYEAGTATGFVARGDHLPVAPASLAAHGKAGSISAPVSVPATSYLPPSASSISGPAADSQTTSDVDGSYSFSYSTNDHSRQESGDTHNNVRGSFSFTAPDDGQTRTVDYEAGAATGFVAKGAHLPVAPAAPVALSHPTVGSYADPFLPAPALPTPSLSASRNFAPANAQSTLNADGSYAFSLSADDHSREESADAQNNVHGSYSFRAKDDGKTRRVDYEAGAATGFVARGDHLPRAPAVASPAPAAPGVSSARVSAGHASTSRGGASAVNADSSYSFSYDAGDHSRQEAGDAAGNVRGSYSFVPKDDGRARRVDYTAGADTGFVATGEHLPAPVPANLGASALASSLGSYSADDGSSGDSSYSYSYLTDSSRKTESSDARGNVRGEYSYTGGDGATRTVSYTASDGQGFVASGDLGPSAAGAATETGTAGSVTVKAGSGHSHGASIIRTGGLTIKQFLPPQSARKYGYVYDTKS